MSKISESPLNPFNYTAPQLRKASTVAVAFAAALIAQGVLTGQSALIAQAVISALGVVGVFAVPNKES